MTLHLSKTERLEFFSSLSPMVTAGIPLVEAISSCGEQAEPHVQRIVSLLVTQISSGSSLSESMESMPRAFDPVSVNVIKAAEEAGTLDQSLSDLTLALQKELLFDESIRSALIYPIFVFVIFCMVLLLMLVFVVPRVATVFERLRVPVPVSTQLLISASLFLQSAFPFVAGTVFIFCVGLFFILRDHPKSMVHAFAVLPVLSKLAVQLDMARFSHTLGLLLAAGMPFPTSIELATNVLITKQMLKVSATCKQLVESGKLFSQGLRHYHKFLPPLFIRMIESGELSGTLSTSFTHAGEYYERQSQRTLKAMTVLLEPVMIVVVGVCVGGMMLSIVAPIYGLISSISGN